MKTTNHVVIYSGGMDSFTLLHAVKRIALNKQQTLRDSKARPNPRVFALSFDYGQRHSRELTCAARVCNALFVPHKCLSIGFLANLVRSSGLVGGQSIVDGVGPQAVASTLVPGRNTVMLSLALAFAEGLSDIDNAVIYYGAHGGSAYPDCQRPFIDAMRETIWQASGHRVELAVPFLDMDKAAVLRAGLSLGLSSLDYLYTWSCYKGGARPCETCATCLARAAAFDAVGVGDPLLLPGQ